MNKPHLHLNLGKVKKIPVGNLGSVLGVVFILIVLFVVYSIYAKIYQPVFTEGEVAAPANIVRVDLKSYQDTIDLINKLDSFVPRSPQLKNSNPFK